MSVSPDVSPVGPLSVVLYSDEAHRGADTHERVTRQVFAQRLAGFMGATAAGEHEAGVDYPGRLYFVPGATLLAADAVALGIEGENDLFGGVTPHAFVATKVISHPLVSPAAAAPSGWSTAFGEAVGGVVLAGFSAFTREDARAAGQQLLRRGPVRLKPPYASAGRDQVVVLNEAALDAELDRYGDDRLASEGLVLEENLLDVITHSVGQVRVAGEVASYWGVQRLTRDNTGNEVYGGSDLLVARGEFSTLLAHAELPPEARAAVRQGGVYDEAAMRLFPGLFVSRRNYDLMSGLDARGATHSGVLEQSWRMGGASGAELAALQAFRHDASLTIVQASTYESYGGEEPPPDAVVYFHGDDGRIGPISKYTRVRIP